MAPSAFDALGTKYQPLSRATFEAVLRERLRPSPNKEAFDLLLAAGKHERDLKEAYQGRAPYELVQNADDVSALGRTATKTLFVLYRSGLAFAHDGPWFSRDNFINLTRGFSDKDPRYCIGHKGIGFRSVLEISPNPRVYRVGGPAEARVFFEFCLQESCNLVADIRRTNPQLAREWVDKEQKGQAFLPVLLIPKSLSPAKAEVGDLAAQLTAADSLYGGPYTTLFWLPFKDERLSSVDYMRIGCKGITAEALEEFVKKEVAGFMPYLRHVRSLRLVVDGKLQAQVVQQPIQQIGKEIERVSLTVWCDGKSANTDFVRASHAVDVPRQLIDSPEMPTLLKVFDKATVVVTAILNGETPVPNPDARFYVYFPTRVPTRTGVSVHADYWIKPDRQGLVESGYNAWLHKQAGELMAGPFLDALAKLTSMGKALRVLAPTLQTEDRDARILREALSDALRAKKAFIPSFTRQKQLRVVEVVLAQAEEPRTLLHLFAAGMEAQRENRGFPEEDCQTDSVRRFLLAMGAEELSPKTIIELLPVVATGWSTDRWLLFYRWAAGTERQVRLTRDDLSGIPAIPGEFGQLLAVGGPRVVCHRPERSVAEIPAILGVDIAFVHPDLSARLRDESLHMQDWARVHLEIRRFQMSELLPRLIRAIAQRSATLTIDEVFAILQFLRTSVDDDGIARTPEFWRGLSRLPLPAVTGDNHDIGLVPAWRLYFPKEWPEGKTVGTALRDIPDVCHLSPQCLLQLGASGEEERLEWVQILERLGISRHLRPLNYSRGRGPRIRLKGSSINTNATDPLPGGVVGDPDDSDSATLQEEQNGEFVKELRKSEALKRIVSLEERQCGHGDAVQELHRGVLYDRFEAIVSRGIAEHTTGDAYWRERFTALIDALPAIPEGMADQYYCHYPTRDGRCGVQRLRTRLRDHQVSFAEFVPTPSGPRRPSFAWQVRG